MKLYKIALRNIRRNKRRSLLSGTAITIAAISIVFLFGFLAGMTNDMKNNLWTYVTGTVRIRNAEYDRYERLNPLHLAIPDYEELLQTIQTVPDVTGISPRITFPGRIPLGGLNSTEQKSVFGWGVDFEYEKAYQNYTDTLIDGTLPQPGSREALIGTDLAEELGVIPGDKFTILAQTASRGSNAMTFTVSGVLAYPLSGMNSTTIQIPLDTVQRFLRLPDQVQEILVKVDQNNDNTDPLKNTLESTLSSSVSLEIQDYTEINSIAGQLELAGRIYDFIALIFFLLAGTVIVNTTIMVIFERMKEIGTLGAMGMTRRQLVRLFFLESFFISAVSGLIGVLIGTGLTAYFSVNGFSFFSDALQDSDAIGIGSTIYPVVNFRSTVVVLLYSVIITSVAVWFPSRRAAKITPVEALRHV